MPDSLSDFSKLAWLLVASASTLFATSLAASHVRPVLVTRVKIGVGIVKQWNFV